MGEQMTIALPDQSSSEDFFLVRMLTDELESGLRLKTERMRNLDCGRRTIVMPAVRNPLVGAFWEKQEIPITGVDSVPGMSCARMKTRCSSQAATAVFGSRRQYSRLAREAASRNQRSQTKNCHRPS
jgi:hypothetical protein